MATVALYWRTYKAEEEMALDLMAEGIYDSPAVEKYLDYKRGYELAKAEFLEGLGLFN